MSKKINIIILLIIAVIAVGLKIAKAEYCQLTSIQPGLYCSTELGDINWQERDKKNCSNQVLNNKNEKCCCIAQKPKEAKRVPPKYMLIGSLIIFFGMATTYFLVTKNNTVS